MKITGCRILFFIGWLSLYSLFSTDIAARGFDGVVTKIVDGDTVKIVASGQGIVVRLWGIDTPEWDQPYANEAKEFLTRYLQYKRIFVTPLYYDDYGRLIAQLKKDGENVNQLLVEQGMAWVHIYYCNRSICDLWKKMEKQARLSRRGLWRQHQPMPPWKWKSERGRYRKSNNGK